MLRALFKNYQALGLSALITAGIILFLVNSSSFAYFLLDPAYVSRPVYLFTNSVGAVVCWLLMTYLIRKFPFYQILGVLGILLIAIQAEHYLHVSENPITIPLLILFWMCVTYFVLPDFFKKYRVLILTAYGLLIGYYFFVFGQEAILGEAHRANFSRHLFLPIPFIAALWVYEQWRWLQTLQADKTKAELALLKSQINPHFFFNTLNNLYGLAIEKSEQAPEVILKLSEMMRYTIYEAKEELVNLSAEVTYLDTYLDLHKLRFRKKVDLQFDHQLVEQVKVAPLLFIILLENAFKHGVERLTENAYIHLQLQATKQQVRFTIENNYETTTTERPPGIGLENLRQRLARIYPNQHELKITQTATTYTAHLTLDLPV